MSLHLMSKQQFREVAHKEIYAAMHNVPIMFQSWAVKQVTDVAGIKANQAKHKKDHGPMWPSCGVELETCRYILHCSKEGSAKTLRGTMSTLNKRLKSGGTNIGLRH